MITLYFLCGHKQQSLGNETRRPTCNKCGAELERVVAPKPRLSGVGNSPLKVKHASR